MGEERTEGAQQGIEYLSVGEAAKLLGVHRNTIHNRIKTGRIKAHKVVEGEREVYRVERDSLGVGRTSAHVHTLDAQRPTASEELEELSRMIATRLDEMIATRLDEIVRVIAHNMGDLREELGAERARRVAAETTLREGMAEERRRREEAERERDELRRELFAIREPRPSPETAEEQQGREQPHLATTEAQEGVRRPWRNLWRRMLRG